MEQYSVKLLSHALQDLDSIYTYVDQTLVEPAIFSLETFPHRCPERRNGTYANRGYRQLLIKNYTIVFRIDEMQRQVLVVTVRYSPSQF